MDTTVPAARAGTMFCPRCGRRFGADAGFCAEDGTTLLPVGTRGDLAGTVLKGKYVLVRLLGRGAFGSVYRAFHVLAWTDVAIKVLHGDFQSDPRLRKQVLKEARAVMGMKSPHAVVVHDVDEDVAAGPFIVMEVLDGQSLDAYVKYVVPGSGRLPVGEVVRLCLQICDALDEAHAKGVVHRDLKPGNIMVVRGRDGRAHAKVVDFGIARVAQTSDTDSTTDSTNRIMGTPAYMSPEQCRTQQVDGRSDLYSLGVIMYELCSGQAPFSAATPQALLVAHVTERPMSLTRVLKGAKVPAPLERLVMSLLQKRPDQRPMSAAAVMVELRAIGDPTAAHSAGTRAWAWVGIVVATIALAGMVGWLSLRPRATAIVMPGPPTTISSAESPAVVDSPKAAPDPASAPPVAAYPNSPTVTPQLRKAALVPEPRASGRREASPIPAAPDRPEAPAAQETAPPPPSTRKAPQEPGQVHKAEGQRLPATHESQIAPSRTKPASAPGNPSGTPSIWEVFD